MGGGQDAFDVGPGGRDTQGLENNTNVGNTWQWNLTTETALWKNAKLELGWVATRGIHLNSSAQLNQIAPASQITYLIENNQQVDNDNEIRARYNHDNAE